MLSMVNRSVYLLHINTLNKTKWFLLFLTSKESFYVFPFVHDTKEGNDYMGVVLNFCCLQRKRKKSLNVLLFLNTKNYNETPKNGPHFKTVCPA